MTPGFRLADGWGQKEFALRTSFRSGSRAAASVTRRAACAIILALLIGIAPGPSATAAPTVVPIASELPPGTILVRTGERALYLLLESGLALRYVVGVGRVGWQWSGSTFIDGKFLYPNWMPPPEVRRQQPDLPEVIPGGAPTNPMGAAALTLAGGAYAIHGTNAPSSIGGFVSYGCVRMSNDDVMDLFGRVRVGTPVVVVP